MAYSDDDLRKLAKEINSVRPDGISIVDTFGAMYEEDLTHILQVLDSEIDKSIRIGFHSHNNQQMAFANSMKFVEILMKTGRDMIVDASLCGMGRGAGNATTELMVNFLNRKCQHNYDLDSIMDAIDIYMTGFQENIVGDIPPPIALQECIVAMSIILRIYKIIIEPMPEICVISLNHWNLMREKI